MRFGKKKAGTVGRKRLTVLFATDLHGSEFTFSKLLRALELWEPDVYVAGGDVAGKGMLPMLRENGSVRARWMGKEEVVSGQALDELRSKALQLGFYPYETDADELAEMREDSSVADRIFERLMFERWEQWLERLDERCEQLEVPAFVIAGNDDPWGLDEATFQERDWVQGADGRVLELAESWTLMSCGLANPTPWQCPRDVPEEELSERLTALADEAGDMENVIANIHVPPFGSALDIAPRLDTSAYPPRAIAGETAPVGSTAVRDFLKEQQPMLSLHGHIHESPGAVRIGRTHSINPGSEYAEGMLRGVLVTIEPGRVVGHQFVTG
jgi:Icc-related predicted phosphoesterase